MDKTFNYWDGNSKNGIFAHHGIFFFIRTLSIIIINIKQLIALVYFIFSFITNSAQKVCHVTAEFPNWDDTLFRIYHRMYIEKRNGRYSVS